GELLPAVTGKPVPAHDVNVNANADADPLGAAGKEPAFKDVKQAIEGAARFAMNMPGAGVAADAKLKDAAAAAAAQQRDVDGVAVAGVSAKSDAALALQTRETVLDVAALKEVAAAPVQQASLAMTQAISGTPADKIAARVGSPGWDNQVCQKIIWMVAGKEQTASLTLNPPDMGPMQVVLSVTGDHASVTFSAAQPEVRQALENALPKLREMLGESGIALGNASVNAGMPEQRQAQQGEQSRQQGSNARFGGAGEAAPNAPAAPRAARPDSGAGLVDTFA
ncbi:MAG: flagellar hook-length control protein FliK, partial [Massilia sp.]|nr:flagellar hook-length control protein FliK [Massilia sp.]